MTVISVLKGEVEKRGLTVADEARRAKVDTEALRRSFRGERRLSVDEFLSLCKDLGLNVSDFDGVTRDDVP